MMIMPCIKMQLAFFKRELNCIREEKSRRKISAMIIRALVYQQALDLTYIKTISAVQHSQLPSFSLLSTARNTFLLFNLPYQIIALGPLNLFNL